MNSISPVRAAGVVRITPIASLDTTAVPDATTAAAVPVTAASQRAPDQFDGVGQMLEKLRTSLGYGVTYGGGAAAAPTGLIFRRDA